MSVAAHVCEETATHSTPFEDGTWKLLCPAFFVLGGPDIYHLADPERLVRGVQPHCVETFRSEERDFRCITLDKAGPDRCRAMPAVSMFLVLIAAANQGAHPPLPSIQQASPHWEDCSSRERMTATEICASVPPSLLHRLRIESSIDGRC